MVLAAGLAVARMTAQADTETPTRDALQTQLDALVESDAASAVLARVTDGDADQTASAGVSQLGKEKPADPGGHFRIGSVTKTFVATIIAQLADERVLAFDDPVDDHLPSVVPGGDAITIRQLLNHTSGLYDYMHDEGYSTNRWRGENRFDHYDPAQLLDVAFGHEPYFAPGEGWHYSNTNYIVLGLLIEAVTGGSYPDNVERRILKPLKLNETSVPGDRARLPRPYAHGYTTVDGDTDVDASAMNPSLDWAAGDMVSTTADLDRFFDALLGSELTSENTLDQMREAVDTGTVFGYGLGLQRFELPCGVSVEGHSGQLLGYTTYSTRDASDRQLTLSYNAYKAELPAEKLMGIFATVYCSE